VGIRKKTLVRKARPNYMSAAKYGSSKETTKKRNRYWPMGSVIKVGQREGIIVVF